MSATLVSIGPGAGGKLQIYVHRDTLAEFEAALRCEERDERERQKLLVDRVRYAVRVALMRGTT